MSTSTLLLVVLVVLLLGGGTLGPRLAWGTPQYGGLGLVIIVVLLLLLTGRLD